jgi:hypothetical protein
MVYTFNAIARSFLVPADMRAGLILFPGTEAGNPGGI